MLQSPSLHPVNSGTIGKVTLYSYIVTVYSGVVHITFALFAKAFREDFLPTDCGSKLQASAPPPPLQFAGGGGG